MLRIAAIGPEQVAGVAADRRRDRRLLQRQSGDLRRQGDRASSARRWCRRKAAADAIVARARGGASFVAATAPAGFSADDISVGPQTRAQFATLAGDEVAAAGLRRRRRARSSGRSSRTLAGTSSRSTRSRGEAGTAACRGARRDRRQADRRQAQGCADSTSSPRSRTAIADGVELRRSGRRPTADR